MVDHALDQLGSLGSGIRFEHLPKEIVERTKHCLLDWMGVAIAGSRKSVSRRVAEYVHSETGPQQASLIGSGARTSTVLAVLANSIAGHALDYDDVHLAIWGHPSATVVPAALALAETHHKSGRDLISSIVAGVEVTCRLGEALTEKHYRAGWHATSTLGVFGSAAAAAHLLGLSKNRWRDALSLAASQASGLQALFGTDAKSYQVGKAASSGAPSSDASSDAFGSLEASCDAAEGHGTSEAAVATAHAVHVPRHDRHAHSCCSRVAASGSARGSGVRYSSVNCRYRPSGRMGAPSGSLQAGGWRKKVSISSGDTPPCDPNSHA